MTLNYLSIINQRKSLQKKLGLLEKEKQGLSHHLNKTKTNDRNNVRQSDRKFKENTNKALSARTKRANKADIQRVNERIKATKRQINDVNSLLGNHPLGRLAKKWGKIKQSFAHTLKN